MKGHNLIAFFAISLALLQAVFARDMRTASTGKAESAAIVSAATDYVKTNAGRNIEFRITVEDVNDDFACPNRPIKEGNRSRSFLFKENAR